MFFFVKTKLLFCTAININYYFQTLSFIIINCLHLNEFVCKEHIIMAYEVLNSELVSVRETDIYRSFYSIEFTSINSIRACIIDILRKYSK